MLGGSHFSVVGSAAFTRNGADLARVFSDYEQQRKPVRDKLNRAAELSIAWYEDMASKMELAPYDFVHDYMLRTGIMTQERLLRDCPAFMRRYAQSRGAA